MIAYIKQFVKRLEEAFEELSWKGFNATKLYLIGVNILLVIFAIWFSNAGLLPFKNTGDFAFFVLLTLILALYRPGWTFLFFIGTLALENVNLAPDVLGISLRPYQLFGFITIISLIFQVSSKRLAFSLPKLKLPDFLIIAFAIGGFLSALGGIDKGLSFKQSIIALSFVALYFLVRIYVQSFNDLKRTMPFFLSTGLVVSIYAIWQNVRFLGGANPFEVMPGRPNGTFTEADWLGMYVTFILAMLFSLLYFVTTNHVKNKNTQIFNSQFSIFKKIGIYSFVILSLIVLILTVSRSAWIGAVLVAIVFLKVILLGNYAEINREVKGGWRRLFAMLKLNLWQWREAGSQLLFVAVAFGIALLISLPLTNFEIGNRAISTAGLQKITISCFQDSRDVPIQIEDIADLEQYGCRHINLEEIENEKKAERVVLEVSRPDPNVNIRAEIYKKSIAQIKENPILGIGWGGISAILGTDERGAGLNASNIFLEVWLGAGLLGFLSFVILLGYLVVLSLLAFIRNGNILPAVFVMLGWTAIVFPNLFNSGIFLGFVWAYLGVSVSLLAKK